MTAIIASDFSRIAPRGAVVAAEVFLRLLGGLRTLKVQEHPASREEARRQSLASFPV